jgi:hypothetical protein
VIATLKWRVSATRAADPVESFPGDCGLRHGVRPMEVSSAGRIGLHEGARNMKPRKTSIVQIRKWLQEQQRTTDEIAAKMHCQPPLTLEAFRELQHHYIRLINTKEQQ